MASTGMKADDSRPASQPPEIGTSNNQLCELCLQALTINDQLAGGTTRVNTSDGTTTLDLSGFAHNDWEISEKFGIRDERVFKNQERRGRDASGSLNRSALLSDPRKRIRQHRHFCAGNQHERRVTLPHMLEISASVVGPCRLCSRLRALLIEQYSKSSWWNEQGSVLCFTIQYEWSEYRAISYSEDEATMPLPSQILDGLAVIVTFPGQDVNEADVYQFDVVAWPGACQEWLGIKNTPPDPDWPTSDRNVGFLRQCIEECISNHERCEKKSCKDIFIPRRLLDLGDCNGSLVRLIECSQTLLTPHPETPPQYATLSYCWGESLAMTTTTANKSQHETTGIEVYKMPAAFQDAIYVAKRLGMRYLWIDALCIVQDDKDDWETEAIMMCDIFAHSKVTISAVRSSSSAQHFLQRPVDEMLTLDFHSTLKPDILGQFSIRLEPRHVIPAYQDIAQSAWVSRAWVWQEELMSTRQVLFGNKTLQFQCGHGILLEDGRYESNRYSPRLHANAWSWCSAVNAYSSRTLTHASDRLKAVAGAAKFIESLYHMDGKQPKYLVGLWQDEKFHMQLRWSCREPSLSKTELMGLLQDGGRYVAPSWSWASRNAGVECVADISESVIQVIKSDLRNSHKTAMVSVEFGSSITLCGKLSQTPVEPSSGHLVKVERRWLYRWEAPNAYGHTDFWLDAETG